MVADTGLLTGAVIGATAGAETGYLIGGARRCRCGHGRRRRLAGAADRAGRLLGRYGYEGHLHRQPPCSCPVACERGAGNAGQHVLLLVLAVPGARG
jgi:hypothetical protein